MQPIFKKLEDTLFTKKDIFRKGISDNKHVLAGALAAAFIYTLVREDSRTRKTQLSGLQDEGIRQYLRHERTDFGSGYPGG